MAKFINAIQKIQMPLRDGTETWGFVLQFELGPDEYFGDFDYLVGGLPPEVTGKVLIGSGEPESLILLLSFEDLHQTIPETAFVIEANNPSDGAIVSIQQATITVSNAQNPEEYTTNSEALSVYQSGSIKLPYISKVTESSWQGSGSPEFIDHGDEGLWFYANGPVDGTLTLTRTRHSRVDLLIRSTSVDDGSPSTYPQVTFDDPVWNAQKSTVSVTFHFNHPLSFTLSQVLLTSNCLISETSVSSDKLTYYLEVTPTNPNANSAVLIPGGMLSILPDTPTLNQSSTTFMLANLPGYAPALPELPELPGEPEKPLEPLPDPLGPDQLPKDTEEFVGVIPQQGEVPRGSKISLINLRRDKYFNPTDVRHLTQGLISDNVSGTGVIFFDPSNSNPITIILQPMGNPDANANNEVSLEVSVDPANIIHTGLGTWVPQSSDLGTIITPTTREGSSVPQSALYAINFPIIAMRVHCLHPGTEYNLRVLQNV